MLSLVVPWRLSLVIVTECLTPCVLPLGAPPLWLYPGVLALVSCSLGLVPCVLPSVSYPFWPCPCGLSQVT
jgi:hypothetical protein